MRAILGACALCCGIFSMPDADASVLISMQGLWMFLSRLSDIVEPRV
jgi:hypothetical protein